MGAFQSKSTENTSTEDIKNLSIDEKQEQIPY